MSIAILNDTPLFMFRFPSFCVVVTSLVGRYAETGATCLIWQNARRHLADKFYTNGTHIWSSDGLSAYRRSPLMLKSVKSRVEYVLLISLWYFLISTELCYYCNTYHIQYH